MTSANSDFNVRISNEPGTEGKIVVTMPEADTVQYFEDHDTRGDNRYPPVRRPPTFPRVIAPESPKQES